MKNIIILFFVLFPFVVSGLYIYNIIKIDSKISYITEKPIIVESNLKQKLYLDKYASKRRMYFFVEKNLKQIKYYREYRGIITGWSILLKNKKYQDNNLFSFYTYKDNSDINNDIPFFSFNNEKKNASYYFDIFQYVKEKNYFFLIFIFLCYLLFGAWLIDYLGGITQFKIVSVFFSFNILYLLILLFW